MDPRVTALRERMVRMGWRRRWIPASELACELLEIRSQLDPELARRLLAAALRRPFEGIPEVLDTAQRARMAWGESACEPLERARFLVVDLETTGLSAERATILEIGAVAVEGLRPVGEFEQLVDPGRPIPARITQLTGIDAKLVEGAPPVEQAIDRFLDWAAPLRDAPFVAHNARFDAKFLSRAVAPRAPAWLDRPLLCTRRLARRVVPRLARYGLDDLSAYFGVCNPARHRALGDARAAARVLVELVVLARERWGLERVGDLLELQLRAPRQLGGILDRARAHRGR